jgi:hypothetical protein
MLLDNARPGGKPDSRDAGKQETKRRRIRRQDIERGRQRCHKRPKSREETPKKGIRSKRLAAKLVIYHN